MKAQRTIAIKLCGVDEHVVDFSFSGRVSTHVAAKVQEILRSGWMKESAKPSASTARRPASGSGQ